MDENKLDHLGENKRTAAPMPQQKKQKATAATLIVAASLCISLASYETIREGNNPSSSNSSPSNKQDGKKPLSARKSSYFATKNESFLSDEDDDYQIKQLREHNTKQAAKIRALRNELVERNQNIHEIKADLFKQVGDPRDRERINEMTQLLLEKEQQVETLLQQIQEYKRAK